MIILTILRIKEPDILGDPDNVTPANPLVTAVQQPDWNFSFAKVILRSIPKKIREVT